MKTLLFLFLFLPLLGISQAKPDTVRIFMLVCDTSTVKGKPGYQDTRPYSTYGYQTGTGVFLDAYKKPLGKNIVLWIAYKTN